MDEALRRFRHSGDYHAHAQASMRTLVLFQLTRTVFDYDQNTSHTVLAHDEAEARQMCHDHDNRHEYCLEWLKSHVTEDDAADAYEEYLEGGPGEVPTSTCERVWLEPGIVATYHLHG